MHVVERKGSGPPVVCVHGYCQSSTFWEPTLDRLAKLGVHGLAVDLPGFAASAAEPGPYTMEGLADALAAFLDVRRIDRIVLVGGSMGGVVAQHFVLRHPDRVSRLLLAATGPYTADPAGALAKAAEMEASPWDEATVTPIVNGFFYKPPPAPELARLRQVALMASKTAAVEAARSNATSRTWIGSRRSGFRHSSFRAVTIAPVPPSTAPRCAIGSPVPASKSSRTPDIRRTSSNPTTFTGLPFRSLLPIASKEPRRETYRAAPGSQEQGVLGDGRQSRHRSGGGAWVRRCRCVGWRPLQYGTQ